MGYMIDVIYKNCKNTLIVHNHYKEVIQITIAYIMALGYIPIRVYSRDNIFPLEFFKAGNLYNGITVIALSVIDNLIVQEIKRIECVVYSEYDKDIAIEIIYIDNILCIKTINGIICSNKHFNKIKKFLNPILVTGLKIEKIIMST